MILARSFGWGWRGHVKTLDGVGEGVSRCGFVLRLFPRSDFGVFQGSDLCLSRVQLLREQRHLLGQPLAVAAAVPVTAASATPLDVRRFRLLAKVADLSDGGVQGAAEVVVLALCLLFVTR
jgi:hypothetical protein